MDTSAIIESFDKVSHTYNHSALRFFPFTADRLVSILRPAPGSKILDVATGTGFVAMAMAQAVGQSGRVIGIDLSEGMMQQAEQTFKKFGLDNIDLFTMDAGKLDFKNNYFDTVTCSFGIFFMPDMAAALKEWHRVLKPGGRLLFTCFQQDAFHPMIKTLLDDLLDRGVEQEKLGVASSRLNTIEDCHALLAEAGFEQAKTEEIQSGYHLRDEAEWWDVVWSSGIRRMVEQLPATVIPEFKQAHLTRIRSQVTDKGLWLNVPVLVNIVTA